MADLKPCPFCGGSRVDSFFVRDGRRVACGCGASMTRYHGKSGDTEGDVRTAWNTRADHSTALLEALKGLVGALSLYEVGDATFTHVETALMPARAAIRLAEGGE